MNWFFNFLIILLIAVLYNSQLLPQIANFSNFNLSYLNILNSVNTSLNYSINNLNNWIDSPCIDPRTSSIFNLTDPVSMNLKCEILAFDFYKYYDIYIPNNWFCNNQSLPTFTTLPNRSFLSVSCNCASGYTGTNCVYSTQEYYYDYSVMEGFIYWVGNVTMNYTNPPNKATDIAYSFNILYLIMNTLSQQILPEDANFYFNGLGRFATSILNTTVDFSDPGIQNAIHTIISSGNDVPMIDKNKVLILSSKNVSQLTYGLQIVSKLNNISDVVLSFPIDQIITKRSLFEVKKDRRILQQYQNIGIYFPKVVLSQNLINDLNNNYQGYSLYFVYTPSVNDLNSTIVTYATALVLKNSSNKLVNVNNLNKFNITIYSPLMFHNLSIVPDLVKSCYVEWYDGSNWWNDTNCAILPSSNTTHCVYTCNEKLGITTGCNCVLLQKSVALGKRADSHGIRLTIFIFFIILLII